MDAVMFPWFPLIPFALVTMWIAVAGFMLAKDKGRNVALWTVLGLIPGVNIACLWFFVGASNLRMERKIDQLLKERGAA